MTMGAPVRDAVVVAAGGAADGAEDPDLRSVHWPGCASPRPFRQVRTLRRVPEGSCLGLLTDSHSQQKIALPVPGAVQRRALCASAGRFQLQELICGGKVFNVGTCG